MAYQSKGTSTPKTALEPGSYPAIFRAPIKDKKLPDQFIKNPATDDGIRAEWSFEVLTSGEPGDGEFVQLLTSTYLSLDTNTLEPKSGAAKLCCALNFGKAPWVGTGREVLSAFDWESLNGYPVLLTIEVNGSGYAKVKNFTALPKAMYGAVKGKAKLPAATNGATAPPATPAPGAKDPEVDSYGNPIGGYDDPDGDVPF